jgi:hypothetical protein
MRGLIDPPCQTIITSSFPGRSARGDVVGYPTLELARKLKDQRLVPAVYQHLEYVLKGRVSARYLEFCRETLLELEAVRLHVAKGIELDLPTSLYKLLSELSADLIEAEHNPIRRALYLRHLFNSRSLPPDMLGQVSLANLSSANFLVRWGAAELATIAPPNIVGDVLRETLVREQMPLLVGLMVEAASLNWRPMDCSLLIDKLRGYCTSNRDKLDRWQGTIEVFVRQFVQHSCKDASRVLGLIAEIFESDKYESDKTAVEGIRRAIRLLES